VAADRWKYCGVEVIRRNLSRGVVPKENKSGFVFKNGLHDGVAIACGNTVTGYPLPLSSPNPIENDRMR